MSTSPYTPQDEQDAGLVVWNLLSIERQLQAQGVSLAAVLAWAARNMTGVNVWPEPQPAAADLALSGEAQEALSLAQATSAAASSQPASTVAAGAGNDTLSGGAA